MSATEYMAKQLKIVTQNYRVCKMVASCNLVGITSSLLIVELVVLFYFREVAYDQWLFNGK